MRPTIYLPPSRYVMPVPGSGHVTRSSADKDIAHPKFFYKKPIDIHGTAATIMVPMKSAII
jgi:hypothetical protein